MKNQDLNDSFLTELAETAQPLIHAKWLRMVATWGNDYNGTQTPDQSVQVGAMIKSTCTDVAANGADAVKTLAALAVILQQLADLHD